MDNKQVFHIAGEIIVVGCISLYFINQIKKLNEEIAGLKDELKSQKEITNRNFNQIYAILNSAFNIPVMPSQVEREQKQVDVIENKSQPSGARKSEEKMKKLIVGGPEEDDSEDQEDNSAPAFVNKLTKKGATREQDDSFKSKENFSHMKLGTMTPISMAIPMGMPMGMPIDGIIINVEETGPRKRHGYRSNRNMDVEITEIENREESHLMVENKDDIDEDVTDKEIEKELKSLGIEIEDDSPSQIGVPPRGSSESVWDVSDTLRGNNNQDIVLSESRERNEVKSSNNFIEDTEEMPETKTVKTTKRKKNLKNSS